MANRTIELAAEALERIPESDLQDILDGLRDGAPTVAEAMGFTPAAKNAIEEIALAYYRARRYGQATLVFAFLLKLEPQRGSAWRGLGACAHAIKKFEEAAVCYTRAMQCNPRDLVTQVFLGEVACLLGKKEQGLALLNQVLAAKDVDPSLMPYVARARVIVGAKGGIPPRIVLMRQGKKLLDELPVEAEGPAFDPNREATVDDLLKNPGIKRQVGELAKLLKEGKTTLAKIGGFTENELEGAYATATQCLKMGKVTEAIQLAGFLAMVDPYKSRYWQLAGVGFQRLKQYPLALMYYGFALAIDGNDARTLCYQGETQIVMGLRAEGVASVKSALEKAQKSKDKDAQEIVKRCQVLLKQFPG